MSIDDVLQELVKEIHPCGVCGLSMHEVCINCFQVFIDGLPDPEQMTAEERYFEVFSTLRDYPVGSSTVLTIVQKRVERLINRPFQRGESPLKEDGSNMLEWWLNNESLPTHQNVFGWMNLAQEAAQSYQKS